MERKTWADVAYSLIPSERQAVTVGLFGFAVYLIQAGVTNPNLWNAEFYKFITAAVIVTGLVNMLLAFHFSANLSDDQKTANSGMAFEAIKSMANNGNGNGNNNQPQSGPDHLIGEGETAVGIGDQGRTS
jgi:hypothetical protein